MKRQHVGLVLIGVLILVVALANWPKRQVFDPVAHERLREYYELKQARESQSEDQKTKAYATHIAEFPEDAPGGVNDRKERREQSRKDSGWYDKK